MKDFAYEELKKTIVYEDDHLLAVNKPSGLLTIKDENGSPNLYHSLFEYVKREKGGKRLFVVHRLDKETSGLLVFAKDIRTKSVLQECFENQAVLRKYEAVCSPNRLDLNETRKVIVHLYEDKNHVVHLSDRNEGKRCETDIRCLAKKNGRSYLDISLVTGRRNQIRLSLMSLNMPIVGDHKYGGIKANRMKLNAYELSFPKNLGLLKTHFSIPKIFEKEFFGEDLRADEKDELLALV